MTAMSPLANLIAMMFLLLVAAAAVAWWTITAPERAVRAKEVREDRGSRPPRGERPDLSNDTVRGARAGRKNASADSGTVAATDEVGAGVRPRERTRERSSGDDPFDRFLDPERRHRDDPGI